MNKTYEKLINIQNSIDLHNKSTIMKRIPTLTKDNFRHTINTIYERLMFYFISNNNPIAKNYKSAGNFLDAFYEANENEINEAWGLFEVDRIMNS